jgi:succinyl-CoA synthetase alpha subunit
MHADFLLQSPRVLVQGITGKAARFWTERMLEYGTNIVGGVTPGKGGETVSGKLVYDTVKEAMLADPTVALVFVPPKSVLSAVCEALQEGIKKIVIVTEHIPLHHTLEIMSIANEVSATIVGPNSSGIVRPDEWMIGIMPSWLGDTFQLGNIGIVSKSGSLGAEVCYQITQAGFGQSYYVGIGGDLVIGIGYKEVMSFFDSDPSTEVVVILGEIGGNLELEAIDIVLQTGKPVLGLIVGRTAPQGKQLGHAGALIEGKSGSAETKISALQNAGVIMVKQTCDLPDILQEVVG